MARYEQYPSHRTADQLMTLPVSRKSDFAIGMTYYVAEGVDTIPVDGSDPQTIYVMRPVVVHDQMDQVIFQDRINYGKAFAAQHALMMISAFFTNNSGGPLTLLFDSTEVIVPSPSEMEYGPDEVAQILFDESVGPDRVVFVGDDMVYHWVPINHLVILEDYYNVPIEFLQFSMLGAVYYFSAITAMQCVISAVECVGYGTALPLQARGMAPNINYRITLDKTNGEVLLLYCESDDEVSAEQYLSVSPEGTIDFIPPIDDMIAPGGYLMVLWQATMPVTVNNNTPAIVYLAWPGAQTDMIMPATPLLVHLPLAPALPGIHYSLGAGTLPTALFSTFFQEEPGVVDMVWTEDTDIDSWATMLPMDQINIDPP